MPQYLEYEFKDTHELVSTFDELPLWSAYFGQLLLKHVSLKRGITVLDIGSGAGFPLLELAERLGPSCTCYGLDTWTNANKRAREKIRNYEVSNVQVIDGSAEKIPFDDGSIDLIVSNLGINNFDNPALVFMECNRVLKPGGRLALTTNLNGHWKEFYNVFEDTARQTGNTHLTERLQAHQAHRGSTETISALFTASGFNVTSVFEDTFEMKFLDGTAFLNHHFVKLGWLSSWKELVPADERTQVFAMLEDKLNTLAEQAGSLTLTVPMAYMEGQKE